MRLRNKKATRFRLQSDEELQGEYSDDDSYLQARVRRKGKARAREEQESDKDSITSTRLGIRERDARSFVRNSLNRSNNPFWSSPFGGPGPSASSSGRGFREMFGERDIPPHFEVNEDDISQIQPQDRSHRREEDRDTQGPDKVEESPKKPDSDKDRNLGAKKRAPPPPPRRPSGRNRRSPSPSDSDPDDSDSGDDRRGPGNRPPRNPRLPPRNPPPPRNPHAPLNNGIATVKVPEFDNRLKVDTIPSWDGNPDNLGRWILKINCLSERSSLIHRQLGIHVPTRFTGTAEVWYYSLSSTKRQTIETSWTTLRKAIGDYFMNRTYIDKQKARANKATFRDSSNSKETPSEYYIRKLEFLNLVYNYNDVELINEIMSGAPSYWVSILTPHLYNTLDEFQLAIKFHEDNLVRSSYMGNYQFANNHNTGERENNRNPFNRFREAKTNLVEWSAATANPPFPKDDANVSPKGTPVSKGGRPCCHCGSDNHWDPECKYARKGEKRARVNLANTEQEDDEANNQYKDLYYELISDEELEAQDFR